ncbi:rod shape-determining protein [Clostridium sp. DSM 100503]|uniref:rod shape-determining protein n=1 Tax=Clostridium sp. DSM 100503 TaxID=2963282 RepID=UPI002149B123|nr:rod shape-determining protein [Clostridium sp. DSM 100503]MCR1951303.1 rod shape-determining protein [Clostridium sp. DSM 100503]
MKFIKRKIELGIDMGTDTILIYEKGKGIILKESSVIAINVLTNKVLAFGEEAKKMLGKTSKYIKIIKPITNGVISDYDCAEKLLNELLKGIILGRKLVIKNVVMSIPSNATELEKMAMIEVAKVSGAKNILLVEKTLAAAIGCGINISECKGSMIIDIGAGMTEIAIISLGGSVIKTNIKYSGEIIDREIIKYIKDKYEVIISLAQADELKRKIGSVGKESKEMKETITVMCLKKLLPIKIEIKSSDIREIIEKNIFSIIDEIRNIVSNITPELRRDILENGITITGGGALIAGIGDFIQEEIGIKIYIPDNSLESVCEGTGKILSMLDKIDIDKDINEISVLI